MNTFQYSNFAHDANLHIVEVASPAPGQVLGPGGVRDRDGRLVKQYRYLGPYTPSSPQKSLSQYHRQDVIESPYKKAAQELIAYGAREAGIALIQEVGIPLLRQGARYAVNRFLSSLSEPTPTRYLQPRETYLIDINSADSHNMEKLPTEPWN